MGYLDLFFYFSKFNFNKHCYIDFTPNFFRNNYNYYSLKHWDLSFLYSLFMVLVFLGGVIVLIIYISTLSANEKFSPNSIYVGTLIFCTPVFLSSSNLLISPYITDNINIITHIYESKNVSILSYLMVYLLITLVCVVKLVKFEEGPLIKRL